MKSEAIERSSFLLCCLLVLSGRVLMSPTIDIHLCSIFNDYGYYSPIFCYEIRPQLSSLLFKKTPLGFNIKEPVLRLKSCFKKNRLWGRLKNRIFLPIPSESPGKKRERHKSHDSSDRRWQRKSLKFRCEFIENIELFVYVAAIKLDECDFEFDVIIA